MTSAPISVAPSLGSLGLDFPDGWMSLPIEPEQQREVCDRLRGELAVGNGRDETTWRGWEAGVELLHDQLAHVRAVSAAIHTEVSTSTTRRDVVMAVGLVGWLDRSDFGPALPLTPGNLVSAAPMVRTTSPRRLPNIVNLEPPAVVRVAGWEGVRLRRHVSVRTGPVAVHGLYAESYFVPSTEDADRVAFLMFTTPNEHLSRRFAPTFAEVADTLMC